MTFEEYTEFVVGMKRWPAEFNVVYPALGLTGESGEVAEKVKKWIRDEGGKAITEERRKAILLELGDVQYYTTALAHDLGFSLRDVIESNVAKLTSRKERNVLHGDGDNR